MSPNYRSAGDKQEAITDGIDICTWSLHRHDQHLTYSVWDFAGQTIYYNTHQVGNKHVVRSSKSVTSNQINKTGQGCKTIKDAW